MHADGDLIVIFVGIAAIVFIASFFGHMNRRNRQTLIEKMIDKGQPLSPDILATIADDKRRNGSIGSAVTLMLIGIGLGVFLWAFSGGGGLWNDNGVPHWMPFVGIFPFMTGLGRLIGLIFDKPKDR